MKIFKLRSKSGKEHEVAAEKILCNDIHLPKAFNYHKTRLWLIGAQCSGVHFVVWADCEQDALDALVDAHKGDWLLIPESEATEDSARLGNASEPANLDDVWMEEVVFDPPKDWEVLMAFAEAKGAGKCETLDDL